MPILQKLLARGLAWLLTLAFAGAGIANAMGGAVVQAQFQRWGYPAWWNIVTAVLEILTAALILVAKTRLWGLALGAVVLIAAVATVTWFRDYRHLPPGVALAALTGIEMALVLTAQNRRAARRSPGDVPFQSTVHRL